jgi:hypothetical protein
MTIDGNTLSRYPVVVESNLTFLPFAYYAASNGSPFVFVVDSETAADPRAILGAGMETKAMEVFRRNGYWSTRIVDGARFLCSNERFSVIDDPQHFWFERRVIGDSAFVWRDVGEFSTMHGSYSVRFVERRTGRIPSGCASLQAARDSSSDIGRLTNAGR